MVQDQLVEYVSTQIKLGVSRDAIKTALVGVGWAPLDVEDTLKKVEGASAVPAQSPIAQKSSEAASSPVTSPKVVSFSSSGTIAPATKSPEPQTIRVSDLVSSVPSSSAPTSSLITAPKIIGKVMDTGKAPIKDSFIKGPSLTFTAPADGKKKPIGMILNIIAIIVIVGLGAFAAYLFMQNNRLQSQLQTAQSGQQSQGTAQTQQVQVLNTSNIALTAQVASLTSANQDLAINLSFFTAPTNSPSPVTSTPVSVSGILSAGLGKNTYIITTTYGVKVSVKNSSTAAVAAMLQPLLGANVQVSGMYIPGTAIVTVNTVNGAPVSLPQATTTTFTATTTATTTTTP